MPDRPRRCIYGLAGQGDPTRIKPVCVSLVNRNVAGRVGSGQEVMKSRGSGRVGSGGVGSGRVKKNQISRVGSGRVGFQKEAFKISLVVGPGQKSTYLTKLTRPEPTREKGTRNTW